MSLMSKVKERINVEQIEEQFKKDMEKVSLEKNDRLAMIIAAFAVFIPALLFVLGFFYGVIYFFFLR